MKRCNFVWIVALIACVTSIIPLTRVQAAHLTPATAHIVPCASVTETDNIQLNGSHNPFTDDLGNQWIVYYDVTQDNYSGRYCDMRVDVRIFNPSPNGAWNGTIDLLAYINGIYDSASYQKVNGSGTYQAHYVWRGPWFGADISGSSYQIKINEFNGSTPYARASADFTL